MIEWKRLYTKPAGSLPGGVVTQYGVGAIAVFVLLFLTYWIWLGGGEPAELPGATETAQTAPPSFAKRMAAQVDAEALRAETQRAAADRILRAQQRQQTNTAGVGGGRVTANEALLLAGPSPDSGQPYTQEEWDLRERLRLEAVERRSRSLRSSPIAQTYRKMDGSGAAAVEEQVTDPLATIKAEGAEALKQALGTFEGQSQAGFEEANGGGESKPIKHLSKHSEERPARQTPRRSFLPRQSHPARAAIILPRLISRSRKTPPVGSESMKAHSSKRCSCRNFPVTSPAPCWPWLPFLSTRRIGSAS